MIRVLALDLATTTGWATNSPVLTSGTILFDVKRGESPGMRFLRFARWLEDVCLTQATPGAGRTPVIDVVCYEQAHHRGGAATQCAIGLQTHLLAFCAKYGIEHAAPIHTATLKKFATGCGKGEKEKMVATAVGRWPGQNIVDDNQADALWLLEYQLSRETPEG